MPISKPVTEKKIPLSERREAPKNDKENELNTLKMKVSELESKRNLYRFYYEEVLTNLNKDVSRLTNVKRVKEQ